MNETAQTPIGEEITHPDGSQSVVIRPEPIAGMAVEPADSTSSPAS